MSGVEFNANLLSALRTDSVITTAPVWLSTLICTVLVIVCSLLLPRVGPKPMLFISVALAIAPVMMTIGSMILAWVHLPMASATVAVLLIYPLWSWRRHEIAWHFIQQELERIGQQSREWQALAPAGSGRCTARSSHMQRLSQLLNARVKPRQGSDAAPCLQTDRDAPLSEAERDLLTAAELDLFAKTRYREAVPRAKDWPRRSASLS